MGYEFMSGSSYDGLGQVWGLGGGGRGKGKGKGSGKYLYDSLMKPSAAPFNPFSWKAPSASVPEPTSSEPAPITQEVKPILESVGMPALPNRYVMSTDVAPGSPQPATVVQQTTIPMQPATTTQIMQPAPIMMQMQMPMQTPIQPMSAQAAPAATVQPVAPIMITPQQARLGAIASAAAAALFFL